MKRTGLEIIVFSMIALMVLAIAVNIGRAFTDPNISVGVNGIVEHRCVSGYEFVIGDSGKPVQILTEYGRGVPCK